MGQKKRTNKNLNKEKVQVRRGEAGKGSGDGGDDHDDRRDCDYDHAASAHLNWSRPTLGMLTRRRPRHVDEGDDEKPQHRKDDGSSCLSVPMGRHRGRRGRCHPVDDLLGSCFVRSYAPPPSLCSPAGRRGLAESWPGPAAAAAAAAAAALLAITLASYWPSLHGGFVWDDRIFVRSKSVTTPTWSGGGLGNIWLMPGTRSIRGEVHYWPVVYTTFWLEHYLYGGFTSSSSSSSSLLSLLTMGENITAATKMRLFNIVLHVANALLVKMLLSDRLGRSQVEGWISAVVFALHPVRVESVAWIIERKDVLSGFFFLLALLVHPNSRLLDHCEGDGECGESEPDALANSKRRRRTDGRGKKKRGGDNSMRQVSRNRGINRKTREVAASLILYVLGLLSKTAAVPLPVVLLIISWYVHGTICFHRDVLPVLPLFVAGVIIVLFDMSIDRESVVGFGHTPIQRLLIGTRAVSFYLRKLFWPCDLTMIYPRWDVHNDPAWIWTTCFAFVASLLVGLFAAAHYGRITGRGPFACLLYFGACLGPSLGLVDYSYMGYSFVADRFQYLAAIGPVAFAGGGFVDALRRRCAIVSRDDSGEDAGTNRTGPRTKQKATVAVAIFLPLSLIVMSLACKTNSHCRNFLDDGTYFGHVVRQNPDGPVGWFHLSEYYAGEDELEKAMECSRMAVDKIDAIDNNAKGGTNHSSLPGPILMKQGSVAHKNYGDVLFKFGTTKTTSTTARTDRIDDAIRQYERALDYNPLYASAWNSLGMAHSSAGRKDDAIHAFRHAVEIRSSYSVAWGNLGGELGRASRWEEALEPLNRCLDLDPGALNPRGNRGLALYNLGRHEEAVVEFRAFLKSSPKNSVVREYLDKSLRELEKGVGTMGGRDDRTN